jgi:iron(III) transport system permease protein
MERALEIAAAPPVGWRPRLRLEHAVIGATAVALVVLVVLPVTSLLWSSIRGDEGFTLEHFQKAFGNRLYFQALKNSLLLGFWVALLSVALGLPMAWAVSRTDTPFKGFIRFTAGISYLTPPFLTAIAFVNLFSPNAGLLNRLFRDALHLDALTFNIHSMAGLVLVTVVHTFPYVYLLAASALESVDASLEESARMLGSGTWRTALTITAPLVAPSVLAGALLAFVNAIALFGSQAIIGLPARIFTLPTRIYTLFDYPPQYGLASALSLLFVAITVLALWLQRRYLARRSYTTIAGKGVRPQLVRLGAARWVVFAFCAAMFAVCIVLPYGTLLAVSLSKSWGLEFWRNLTLENFRFILFEYDVTRRAIVNSLILASAAATLAVLIGAIVAWMDLRTRIPGRRFLDYVSLVPLGLPGIVMAVALIQFWLRAAPLLYGTLAILLLAYVARFIPLGVRAASAALRQIDPSLEEGARITGASWGRTMQSITLPLMRGGLVAGWLLVFVPAIQELSASILLFSSSSMTLAVAVYNLYETGYLEPVSALAIVNMVIIGGAMWLASRAGRSRLGVHAGAPQ